MPLEQVASDVTAAASNACARRVVETAHQTASTAATILSLPKDLVIEASKAAAVWLLGNAFYYAAKGIYYAGSSAVSAAGTAASNTYAWFFPPQPLAIAWHKDESADKLIEREYEVLK